MFKVKPETLSFHACIVLVLGMLSGFVIGQAISANWPEAALKAWKLAHMQGLTNGLLMLVIAANWQRLVLSAKGYAWLWGSLLAGGYANILGAVLGAITGERGIEPVGPWTNWLVMSIFAIGLAPLIGVLVAAKGYWRAAAEQG